VIIILYAFKNTPDFESQHTHFLWEELSYPFEDMTRSSFAVSVAVNIIIDYFALLKTRILVKLLAKTRPSIFLGIVFVIFDFLFSFVLFQCFYLLLDVASLIFIFGGKKFFLPAADPYSFYMTIEVLILSEFLLSPTSAPGTFYKFLTHSHVATLMILLTLAPISLVSVFFYASMMPSIWLWLFLLAASASRAIGTVYPWAIRALDFEQNAIRTLGYFLSILLSVVWLGFVGGVTLYFFILLRLAAY